jgi:hypothetical protein
MSCILYSRASYVNLSNHPAFVAAFQESLRYQYDSAEAFGEALFEFNATAYRDRYSRGDETPDEIEQERESTLVDGEFARFILEHKYATPKAYAALWELFGRIEYQCSDANNHSELPIMWHLGWARDFCARRLVAAVNNQPAPPPATEATARVRDELNLILRIADDSADFQTADVVCKAALRAEKLLIQIERSIEQEPARLAA